MTYKKWDKELNKLQEGTGKYEWDELEELITDAYEEERWAFRYLILNEKNRILQYKVFR